MMVCALLNIPASPPKSRYIARLIGERGEEFVKSSVDNFLSIKGPFEQALAQFTTKLMNARELDKDKVKEILER